MKTRTCAASLCTLLALASPGAAQLVFEPPLASDGGEMAWRVLVGDIDEDGLADAVTSHYVFGPPPQFSKGLGDGSFDAPQRLSLGGAGGDVGALADFNGDNHLDLLLVASSGFAPPLNVAVLPGDGAGGFGTPVGINSNHGRPFSVDTGDFDGNGALDVAIYNEFASIFPGSITVVLGNGDGSFQAPLPNVSGALDFGGGPRIVRAGDVNGDGLDDIVYTRSNRTPVLLSQGNGVFVEAPCVGCPVITERDFVLADLDADGFDDALTTTRALLSDGAGTLVATQTFTSTPFLLNVSAGDLDGDGALDAVLSHGNSNDIFGDPALGDVRVLRGLGDGSFKLPELVISHVPQPRQTGLADMDGDGRPDIVVASILQGTDTTLRTLRNHTYGAGSPFTDLGGALLADLGSPIFLAEGSLIAGEPFAFRLANGPPGGSAYLFAGPFQFNLKFKGGVMIPSVNLILGPVPVDGAGEYVLPGPAWPGGASGLSLYMQFWMPAAGGPAGFASTSGVRAQVP